MHPLMDFALCELLLNLFAICSLRLGTKWGSLVIVF